MTVELDESINKINSLAIDNFIDNYLKSTDYHFYYGHGIKEHLKYVIISNWKDFVILLNNKKGPIKVGIHSSIGNIHTQVLSDYFKLIISENIAEITPIFEKNLSMIIITSSYRI
ncbi:hypothetical protein MX022_07715 [Streptococcus uberis]|uniref:hypothetical protein n=1 Tax=Streptococcus uberis TaxID=1349 RepID=UPI001FF0F653|nr:hypothetical protein [Streptococcus uberis]MCK1191108.1 hypothetical protein [Streptococcus uberis]MCK1209232.1 hypothetical protein [Streptococcus uberis]MCK1233881.1 hypothetical protein [Streptococcus uberis]MCK1244255.1 hypothetical protein [Streptococcus uberis]